MRPACSLFALGMLLVAASPAAPAAGEAAWLFRGSNEDLTRHWIVPRPRPRKTKSGEVIPAGKWHVTDDGSLECLPPCGCIWTKERFSDFVLDCEFKVSQGANSGLFFRANPRNAVQGGMEIQILDSYGKKPSKHSLGALYDCKAPSKNTAKPAGEWQRMILTARDNAITVDLNGERVLEVDLNQWTEPHKNPDGSKNKFRTAYRDMPRTGHIGFQDHGRRVWFRNVRVKRLPRPGG